ncbi:MAG: AAA family ATPase, partial [Dehalococcoidia bacterium]
TMDNSKLSDIPHVSYDQEDTTKNKKVDTSKIRNLKDISYMPIQKFWKRLGQYVTIKQFSEIDADVITGGREFPTLASYRQYIVTVCVEDIEDLFQKLDQLGLPKRVPSQDLIYELYDLCIISNQFLAPDATKPSCESDIFNQQKTATSDKGLPENTENTAKVKLFKQVKKETLLGLSSEMKTKVIGQDQALDTLVEAIQRASVGLKDPDHPLGAFVFAGYSGTGKTHTAKVLAELLTGSGRGLVSVDCSEYSSDHEYSKLIGAPSGYIGYEQGGYLTNAIKKQPFSVVLFDEIEKASDKVHQLLLQVMDEARLTDGKGHPVSFKDTIIIMTSNIGVKEVDAIGKTIGFGDANVITNDKRTQAVESALKNQFKPEFLTRLTSIINFNSLTKENYLQIIKLELEKLKLNLKLSGTEYSQTRLKFDESLLEYIYGKGIDESYGARPLKRYIEQEVSTPLARKLLQEPIPEMSMVFVSIKDGTLSIDVVKGQDDVPNNPPFYMGNSAGECQGEQTNV